MINNCTLTGNIGADPEIFYNSEGNPVTSFNIAFQSSKKKTGWIKVVCFQKLAEIASIYEAYDLEKAKKYLLDFDDLLIETYSLLTANDNIRGKYSDRYQHLLVDEFQDTNPVQLEINQFSSICRCCVV